MRGFQIFSTGFQEVPESYNKKSDHGFVPTKSAKPINKTIYRTVKRAENALLKERSNILKIGNKVMAKEVYLVELDFDEYINQINNYICVWMYAPWNENGDSKEDIMEF